MRFIDLVRGNIGEDADRPQLGFPAASAWGKVYYQTGRAQQMLGNDDEARQLLSDWVVNRFHQCLSRLLFPTLLDDLTVLAKSVTYTRCLAGSGGNTNNQNLVDKTVREY